MEYAVKFGIGNWKFLKTANLQFPWARNVIAYSLDGTTLFFDYLSAISIKYSCFHLYLYFFTDFFPLFVNLFLSLYIFKGKNFIFTTSATPNVLGKTKAYLISPQLSFPYCMNFLYKISSTNSKMDVILLRQNNPVVVHKVWECKKCNDSGFKNGQVSLSYSKEYQVG
jgi:hypothetical protein